MGKFQKVIDIFKIFLYNGVEKNSGALCSRQKGGYANESYFIDRRKKFG